TCCSPQHGMPMLPSASDTRNMDHPGEAPLPVLPIVRHDVRHKEERPRGLPWRGYETPTMSRCPKQSTTLAAMAVGLPLASRSSPRAGEPRCRPHTGSATSRAGPQGLPAARRCLAKIH
ncbi:hypothetical protein ACRAWF_08550, partial [Streptomyces sp. L7]